MLDVEDPNSLMKHVSKRVIDSETLGHWRRNYERFPREMHYVFYYLVSLFNLYSILMHEVWLIGLFTDRHIACLAQRVV